MLDRRKSQRMRSYRGGRIVFNRHWPEIDCTVRNLSASGAFLELSGEYNTALEFDLTFVREHETRPCRQVWREGNRIGAAFV